MMRAVIAVLLLMILAGPVQATTLGQTDKEQPDAGLKWMKDYQENPAPQEVPGLIKRLSGQGAFEQPEQAGVYVGFLAGVLHDNPDQAVALAADCLPLPFKDQWLVVRAIAYSGLEDWERVMIDFARHLPERKHLMRYYISGQLPTLDEIPFAPKEASALERLREAFRWGRDSNDSKPAPVEITYATHPELIDVQWGLYFATGEDRPIAWIAALLPWSDERDSLEKLTVGGMAKFTLAVNAARDPALLAVLRRIRPRQPDAVRPILGEVIITAETADTARLQNDVTAAIDELRQKGPGSQRATAWWAEMGQVALSLGCVGASALGQVQLGVPCVVGGALSSAALRYLGSSN
jgi:hypothetical protein